MSRLSDFRTLLLTIQDLLSDNDRHRFYVLLGEDVPKHLRDDPSPGGALRVLESLFQKAIISDQNCDYLIEAFKKIHCNDAAKRLQEYQRIRSPCSQRSFSSHSIRLLDNNEEDKFCLSGAGIPHQTKMVVRARGFEMIEMDTTASPDGSDTKSTK